MKGGRGEARRCEAVRLGASMHAGRIGALLSRAAGTFAWALVCLCCAVHDEHVAWLLLRWSAFSRAVDGGKSIT